MTEAARCRIFLGGLSDNVSVDDVSSLLASFQPSDIHVTMKGFAFATILESGLHSCLTLNKTKWKGNKLLIEKSKKEDYKSREQEEETKSDLSEDSDDMEPKIKGTILGPRKEPNTTLMQWIWTEAEDEKSVRKARKQGWKLIRISTEPKKEGKRRIVFHDRTRYRESLQDYYTNRLPYLAGEIDSVPEPKRHNKKKLEDIWGSSSEEEDENDAGRFGVDDRFLLDSRFTEHELQEHNLHQMKLDGVRSKRMAMIAESERTAEDMETVPEDEDVIVQIRKERTNALDILTSMRLHNPSDTLEEGERHQSFVEADPIKPDDTEVLWGKPIMRYDPSKDISEEEEEEDVEGVVEGEKEKEGEEEKEDDAMAVDEVEIKPKEVKPKEVIINTSWAQSSLSGSTWSLFGDSGQGELSDSSDDDMEDGPDSMVAQTSEMELGTEKTPKFVSMKFFGFADEALERQDESDLFMRQESMEEVEKQWRDTRRNIITDYKRKSKQAIQRSKSKK